MSKRLFLLLTLLTGLASFLWGVAYVRYYVFPYRLVRSLENALVPEQQTSASDSTSSGGLSVRETSTFEAIRSLPYVGLATVSGHATGGGATVYEPDRSYSGINLFTAGHTDGAALIDMGGKVLHRWRLPRQEVWWDSPLAKRQSFVGWRSSRANPDLSLYAIFDYLGLVKIDRSSAVKWIYRGGCHHDFWISPAEEIYVLTYREDLIPELNRRIPIIADHITVLSSSGEELRSYSLVDLILRSPYAFLLPSISHFYSENSIDLLHSNSIDIFDGSLARRSERLFKQGNALVSVRNLSTVFIIDLEQEDVVWAWGPTNVAYQHDARLLASGNILLFNNGLTSSSVIEMNPITREISWQFRGTEAEPFFSRSYGANQRLPNGNTLITESLSARALEVTRDGDVVWLFESPLQREGKPVVLFEMTRYDRGYFTALD